jgi:mRNA interferase MazF
MFNKKDKRIQKDFDTWNDQKKDIHKLGKKKLYRSRDIWWCNLGINIGFEQDGTGEKNGRPVLILKGLSQDICLVVPLTTSSKKHFMRIDLGRLEDKNSSAIISQIRVVDTKRFVNKMGKLRKDKFEEIRKAVKNLI